MKGFFSAYPQSARGTLFTRYGEKLGIQATLLKPFRCNPDFRLNRTHWNVRFLPIHIIPIRTIRILPYTDINLVSTLSIISCLYIQAVLSGSREIFEFYAFVLPEIPLGYPFTRYVEVVA